MEKRQYLAANLKSFLPQYESTFTLPMFSGHSSALVSMAAIRAESRTETWPALLAFSIPLMRCAMCVCCADGPAGAAAQQVHGRGGEANEEDAAEGGHPG